MSAHAHAHALPEPAPGAPQTMMRERMQLDPSLLRVLADPVRSFLVYSLVAEAKTVKTLAQELGAPVTRLYYHMRQLEKHGLVFVEKTRLVSGIVEKHYRATARELVLDREAFAPGRTLDRSRSEALLGFVFDQSRVDIARALDDGRIDIAKPWPTPDSLMATRTVLRLDAAQAERLYARLAAFWQEYEDIARNPAPDGRFYALVAALYPNAMGGAENGVAASSEAAPAPKPRRSHKRP